MKRVCTVAAVAALAGCATSSTGVVPIGSDMYMLGSQGGLFDDTASQVKARLYKEAQQFCAGKGKQVAPINSTGQDARTYDAASAEIQFRCVEP